MPLDGHSYLISQGWSGKGTGLREGAISRPIAIVQKKSLAGLGKDRDEAFPFWDHLFSAAAKSIQVKIFNEDDDSDNAETISTVAIKRTTTGILSNRRPVSGTPADSSGATTPDVIAGDTPQLSLLATAKREAAKQGLYARFFRGPVLGPNAAFEEDTTTGCVNAKATVLEATTVAVIVEATQTCEPTAKENKKKKRKSADEGHFAEADEKRERKRLKREAKEAKRAEREARRERKRAKEEKRASASTSVSPDSKENKERRKDEETAPPTTQPVEDEDTGGNLPSTTRSETKKRKKSSKSRNPDSILSLKANAPADVESDAPNVRKKRRKRETSS